MGNYRQLTVWKRSYAFALLIYRATSEFPADERYGLTSQLRRSAFSIAVNVAEGCGRSGQKELSRFLRIARGSANETMCQLMLARDLGYLPRSGGESLLHEANQIGAMISAWLGKLDREHVRPTTRGC
jgi:four helix bundle protein